MSSRVNGVLVGIFLSCIFIALYVLVYVKLNLLAGWIGAFIGISFVAAYKGINTDDKSIVAYILAIFVVAGGLVVAEGISLFLIAASHNESIIKFFGSDLIFILLYDLGLGFLLSMILSGLVMYSMAKKERKLVTSEAEESLKQEVENKVIEEKNNFVNVTELLDIEAFDIMDTGLVDFDKIEL